MSKPTFKPKLPLELCLSDALDQVVCPGCGKVNPRNREGQNAKVFTCAKCSWECDCPLPPVRKLMRKRGWSVSNDVNLPALLRAVLKPLLEQ